MSIIAVVFSNGLVKDLGGHEGIMLSEGLHESVEDPVNPESLSQAVLVKVNTADAAECRQLIEERWSRSGIPVERLEILTDDLGRMRRRHRTSFRAMEPGGMVLHGTWLAYRRGHQAAEEQARRLLRNAALRRPWQFWR